MTKKLRPKQQELLNEIKEHMLKWHTYTLVFAGYDPEKENGGVCNIMARELSEHVKEQEAVITSLGLAKIIEAQLAKKDSEMVRNFMQEGGNKWEAMLHMLKKILDGKLNWLDD